MASKTLMEAPICLVDNDADRQLQLNPRALEILAEITQPVVVVAIMGLYRTGKSYLMNKLAGQEKGFSLGSTIQSVTKGIWMWCIPHPHKPDHTLVLLDTEGLGDVEKGDTKNDSWIFALAVLLSSTLVYNSMGTIDQYALERLQLVSELSDLIKVKSKRESEEEEEEEEDGQFVRYFPNFIWVVRDFSLELKIDGRDLTEKEYLEHALELKKGDSKKVMEFNLPRQCIRKYFPKRTCFVLPRPVEEKDMNKIESLAESTLNPQFIQQTHKFCHYVFEMAEVKTVKGGHRITGRMFSFLVRSYVETIRSGKVPCMDNAVLSMATIENEAAVKEAVGHYTSRMQELCRFPAEVRGLSQLHEKCQEEALQIFMKRSFKDEGGKYQQQLMVEILQSYQRFRVKNKEASVEICANLLQRLSATMEKKLAAEVYSRPGGYEMYIQDRDQLVEEFRRWPNKGVKAQVVLDKFLAGKKMEAEAILRADKNLTEAERKLAEEKEKAALMAQEKEAAEEKRLQVEQLLEDEKCSNQENMKQLEAKMAEVAANLKEEAARALESKLKEHEQMLEKGFKQKAKNMEEDMSALREELKSARNQEMYSRLATTLALELRKMWDELEAEKEEELRSWERSLTQSGSHGEDGRDYRSFPLSCSGTVPHCHCVWLNNQDLLDDDDDDNDDDDDDDDDDDCQHHHHHHSHFGSRTFYH